MKFNIEKLICGRTGVSGRSIAKCGAKRGGKMRFKSRVLMAGLAGLAMPAMSKGSILAAYNMGTVSGTVSTAATTVAANISASALTPGAYNSAGGTVTFSDTTVVANDPGVAYYSNQQTVGGPNMISVSETTTISGSDLGYGETLTVTANAGYLIDPTSFELYGGAGGSSNVRSYYIYDNVDGFPNNMTPSSSTPSITGGDLLASGSFTAVRSTSVNETEGKVTSFPVDDVNLSSFTVCVFFDTQAQVAKNIDLGDLELDGTVVPSPEPQAPGVISLAGLIALAAHRRRSDAAKG
jgi:hypothetical protein